MWAIFHGVGHLIWHGVWYPVVKEKHANALEFRNGCFYSHSSFNSVLFKTYAQWLKDRALEWLVGRCHIWAFRMDLNFKSVKISDARTAWGYCSCQRVIYLNWRLMGMPIWVQDYIIIHELAHVRFFHHGREFWNFVNSYCHEVQRAQNWLKQFGEIFFQSPNRILDAKVLRFNSEPGPPMGRQF